MDVAASVQPRLFAAEGRLKIVFLYANGNSLYSMFDFVGRCQRQGIAGIGDRCKRRWRRRVSAAASTASRGMARKSLTQTPQGHAMVRFAVATASDTRDLGSDSIMASGTMAYGARIFPLWKRKRQEHL